MSLNSNEHGSSVSGEFRALEGRLRHREQQLAAVNRLLGVKNGPEGENIKFSVAQLTAAKTKLEDELPLLRQRYVDLERELRAGLQVPSATLVAVDRALGILEPEDGHGHRSPTSQGYWTAPGQVPTEAEASPVPSRPCSPISAEIEYLRKEQMKEHETNLRAVFETAFSLAQQVSVSTDASLADSPEKMNELASHFPEIIPDTSTENMPRFDAHISKWNAPESIQKRRRLELAPTRDYIRVLQPDVQSPFTDKVDAWQRLHPYHIYLSETESERPTNTPLLDEEQTSSRDQMNRAEALP